MADTEVSVKEIPLLGSKHDYAEVFRFVYAFNYIYQNAEKLNLVTVEDVLDENGKKVKDQNGKVKQNKKTTVPRLMQAIVDNWDSIKLNASDMNTLYPNKPTLDDLTSAMANAQTLSGHKDTFGAVKDLYANPQMIKNCYAEFAGKQNDAVENVQGNLNQGGMNLAESKKQNRKAKSKRFWSAFGMGATALLTGGIAGGYLVGAFGLAGGLAGLASISTMPFAMLAVVGGVALYKVGSFAFKKIWGKLKKSFTDANDIIKGEEETIGSKKNLKMHKNLQAQNDNALKNAKSRTLVPQPDRDIMNILEENQGGVEQQKYEDEVLDLGPASARTPLEEKAEEEIVYEAKNATVGDQMEMVDAIYNVNQQVFPGVEGGSLLRQNSNVDEVVDEEEYDPYQQTIFGGEYLPETDPKAEEKQPAVDEVVDEEEYDPYQQTILDGEYLPETEPKAEEKQPADDNAKKPEPKIESFEEIMKRAQEMKKSEPYNAIKSKLIKDARRARIINDAQRGKVPEDITNEEIKDLKKIWHKTGKTLRDVKDYTAQEEILSQEQINEPLEEMSKEEKSEFVNMVRSRRPDDVNVMLKALNIVEAGDKIKKNNQSKDNADELAKDIGMDNNG